MYDFLFKPRSIAVIGASNDEFKPGGRVTKNIKENGYEGDLWTVNPKAPSIMGLPTYPSIEDLPGSPDLAIIAIPSGGVRAALESLALKGTKATIILTAGFGEKDEKGKEEERRFLEIASKANMGIVGPNCSGFMTTSYAGKFTGILPRLEKRSIDIVSGSGATVDYLMEQATFRGLAFSNVVNMGNSIQLCVEDVIEMLDENYGPESAPIMIVYMESLKKPEKLLVHARSLTRKGCTLVGVKSGVTTAGEKAAASHTGAMATDDNAVQALFDKAGIIRVNSKVELIDVACALSAARGPIKGKRACIITDAGGPGVMLSDELSRQGLELTKFGRKTQKRLAEILPMEASYANPIDCLPSRTGELIKKIFGILKEEEKENIDVITIITGNSGMSDNWEIYKEIINGMNHCSIPIIPVLSSATTCEGLIARVRSEGKFYFQDEVPIGRALGKIVNRPLIFDQEEAINGYDRDQIEAILRSEKSEVLSAGVIRKMLEAAGFLLPPQREVFKKEDFAATCDSIKFPLVLKVIGLLHKSDAGGVKIGIKDQADADKAWDDLMAIPGAQGVMIQKMISGSEVILGAVREEGYGHMVVFGLGGIYTEVLKDISFSLAPLAVGECERMIRSIRSFPILEGARGEKGVSINLLSEYLVRLGRLVSDFPEIKEIDLNPVKGFGEDLYVVDARIIRDL
ncbi:MAG: acetate--CoA ligase family protein [Deltaproteobacteria bacterium]|nr:acetate--CoA ligase family protein [Deltaproteobacteria bacterium]